MYIFRVVFVKTSRVYVEVGRVSHSPTVASKYLRWRGADVGGDSHCTRSGDRRRQTGSERVIPNYTHRNTVTGQYYFLLIFVCLIFCVCFFTLRVLNSSFYKLVFFIVFFFFKKELPPHANAFRSPHLRRGVRFCLFAVDGYFSAWKVYARVCFFLRSEKMSSAFFVCLFGQHSFSIFFSRTGKRGRKHIRKSVCVSFYARRILILRRLGGEYLYGLTRTRLVYVP